MRGGDGIASSVPLLFQKMFLRFFNYQYYQVAKSIDTATVLLCSLGVGVCIWLFDAVAVLAVKTLIGVFAG